MPALFVTATGTDIGKTFVTRLLLRQLGSAGRRGRAVKPVATGFDPARPQDSDPGLLLQAQQLPLDERELEQIAPWRFRAPLSPDMAAAREGREVPFGQLIEYCTALRGADNVLIEGIGGVMVPLDRSRTVLDWIDAVGAPVLLVAGSYLGSLSHALTAAEVLRARGARLAAVIVNHCEQSPVDPEETAAVLARFLGPVPVTVLPRLPSSFEGAPDLLSLLGTHLE